MGLIPLEKHTRSPFTAGIKETTIVNGGSKPKLSKQACAVSHEYRDPFWCRKADQNWRINVQVATNFSRPYGTCGSCPGH
jgi:hypothetical protein